MTIKTLQDAFSYFSDSQRCIDYVVAQRWPDGKIACPTCGSEAVTWLPTRKLFQCKDRHSKRQFSVKVGTLLEDSPIALGKWLLVMWMLGSCRNGVSSYEVMRTIGVTQKSAWFMLHRLREGMRQEAVVLSGVVEADEAYIGPRHKNQHVTARRQGRYKNKQPVFGMVERGGKVAAITVTDTLKDTIHPLISRHVEAGATLYTDAYALYDRVNRLPQKYDHSTINHVQDRFVRGPVHTNTIENFWSVLKRTIRGTYISVRPEHLGAYVGESCFRFNHRKDIGEQLRFNALAAGIYGKRLTYKELIARTAL